MLKEQIKPRKIGHQAYYTVEEFAIMTNHSQVSIRRLMCYGNRIRRLKVYYFYNKPLIPASELREFPFTAIGRSLHIYHYNENGEMVDNGEVINANGEPVSTKNETI